MQLFDLVLTPSLSVCDRVQKQRDLRGMREAPIGDAKAAPGEGKETLHVRRHGEQNLLVRALKVHLLLGHSRQPRQVAADKKVFQFFVNEGEALDGCDWPDAEAEAEDAVPDKQRTGSASVLHMACVMGDNHLGAPPFTTLTRMPCTSHLKALSFPSRRLDQVHRGVCQGSRRCDECRNRGV